MFPLFSAGRLFSVTLRLAAVCFIVGAQLQARADIEKEILGKWSYTGKQAGATIESTAEFKEKGVYACKMRVGILGAQSTITFKGKWRVEEEAHVVIEVTETSSPLFLPKGKIMRKESVKIKDDVMEYRYSGKPEREVRVVESNEDEQKAEKLPEAPSKEAGESDESESQAGTSASSATSDGACSASK